MDKFTSIEDLKLARKEILETKRQDKRIKILVHMGTCCIAAGSSEIIKVMKSEVEALSLEDEIEVVSSGCIGLCYAEPTVCIMHQDGNYEVYGNVDSQQGRIMVNRCKEQSPIMGVTELKPHWKAITVCEGE